MNSTTSSDTKTICIFFSSIYILDLKKILLVQSDRANYEIVLHAADDCWNLPNENYKILIFGVFMEPFTVNCLLLSANCLLLTVNCLLLTANCLLLTANCLLLTTNCLLLTSNCLLLTANCYCLLSTVYCLLTTVHTAYCQLYILLTANCLLLTTNSC